MYYISCSTIKRILRKTKDLDKKYFAFRRRFLRGQHDNYRTLLARFRRARCADKDTRSSPRKQRDHLFQGRPAWSMFDSLLKLINHQKT